MKRAGLLIGVHQVKEMPTLHAVLDGVQRMEKWARGQGMQAGLVRTITDEHAPVTSSDIELAVVDLLETDGIEQLVIYFAGHGVNVNYNEYWLLSNALKLSSQSVNLRGSLDRARYCGLKHVVFLSDACRSAPATMVQQGTTGTVVFPNPAPGSKKTDIDVFYATRLGEPALEIDPQDAANEFRAVYTDSLVEALNGQHKNLLEVDQDLGVKVIRPRPLSEFLEADVPKRVFQLTHSFDATQVPEAIITSDPQKSWISDASKGGTAGEMPGFAASPEESPSLREMFALRERTNRLIAKTIVRATPDLEAVLRKMVADSGGLESIGSPSISDFAKAAATHAETFGPEAVDSHCGFKIRGDSIVEVVGELEFKIQNDGEVVEIDNLHRPASVLLVFRSGYGALVAAFPEFLGSVTMLSQGNLPKLSDVSYEPSRDTWRWSFFEEKQAEIRQLRAVVAASSQQGIFRLSNDEQAKTLARRMQLAKGIDPSLALYAAHAYAEQGLDDRLQEMAGYLRGDLGAVPFDIALLARQIHDTVSSEIDWTVPFLPMLSQTWASLAAFNVSLPPGLEEISGHLVPGSLWSLYQPAGVQLLQSALLSGGIQ